MATKAKEMEAIIRIGGHLDPSVQVAIKKTTTAINGLQTKFLQIEKAAAIAGAAIATAFAGASVAIGKTAMDAARGFEREMSNVATLLDGDVNKRVAELGEEVRAVSKETGASTSDLTEGLYQVVSAFGDSADAIKIMDIAARAGVAGNASTIESINLLSAVTKGYGDTSAEANSKAADLAFMTVKLGQTSFPELAASLGRVIPLAATMGVKQEELFGVMATLTGVTGKATEVTTQLRGVVQGFLQPTDAMSEAIQELGYADGKAMLASKGLADSLVILKKFVKDDEIAFSSLFGSVEAKGAVLALAGNQLDTFREKTAAMYQESTGAAARAFDAQTDNVDALTKKLKAYWHSTMIEVGESVLPVFKELFERLLPHMQEAMDKLRDVLVQGADAMRAWAATVDWQEVGQKFMATMTAVRDAIVSIYTFVYENREALVATAKAVTAIWVAFHAVFAAVKAFAAVKGIIAGVSAAFAALTSPIGLVVVAIAAVGVAVWQLWEHWDEVCQFCAEAWDKLTAEFKKAWEAFSTEYSATAKLIEAAWNLLADGIRQSIDNIVFIWKNACESFIIAWKAFAAFIGPAWEAVKEAWNVLCTSFDTVFKIAMGGIESTLNVLNGIIGGHIALFTGDWEGACAHFKAAFEAVVNFWKNSWETIVSGFQSNLESFRKIADAIKEAFVAAWDAVADRVKAVVESIMNHLQPIIDKVQGFVGAMGGAKEAISNSKFNPSNWFAAGGFTNGPSICGEAGTEAVISFDPAHRRENQGYLMTAAEMLGMTASTTAGTTTYNLGGVTFSPVITVGEHADRGDILRKLRACVPELLDLIESSIMERNAHRYA